MPSNNAALETHLWDALDDLCANSKLKLTEYSVPVLYFIFLPCEDPIAQRMERIVAQNVVLLTKNANTQRTRSLRLPKFMSGEVTI